METGNVVVACSTNPPSTSQVMEHSSNPTIAHDTKPKKRMCCACPDTKRLRDECIVEHGEAACKKWIEAHIQCLRMEGFNV